ncbi:MAG: Cna B-type domain-containing protein, partial [Oscillospiraceae bacterium]|nr:Cna B-type domain-containing protein [Oscillospiraceae bacterium]
MKTTWGKRTLSAVASLALVLTSFTGKFPGAKSTKVSADGGTASDGLPIFDDYTATPFYQDNPLGIPGNFHLFGFHSVTTRNHVNGNFATPVYHKGNLASQGINQEWAGRTLSVISKSMDEMSRDYNFETNTLDPWDAGAAHGWDMAQSTDLYVPVNNEITKRNGSPIDYPCTAGYGDTILHYGPGSGDIVTLASNASVRAYAHASENFIDFEAERNKAFALSKQFSEMEPTIDVSWEKNSAGERRYSLATSGTNVIRLKATDIIANKNTGGFVIDNVNLVDDEYRGNQTLIVNIDMEELAYLELDSNLFKFETVSGQKLSAGQEQTALKQGTNVLYNIYNYKEFPEGSGKKAAIEPQQSIGAYLAPGMVLLANSCDGTLIADDIVVEAETHTSFFRNPVVESERIRITGEKVWGDGNSHDGETVRLTLYRTLQRGMNLEDVVGIAEQGEQYLAEKFSSIIQRQMGTTKTFSLNDAAATATGSTKLEGAVTFERVTDDATGTDYVACGTDGTYRLLVTATSGAGLRARTTTTAYDLIVQGGRLTIIRELEPDDESEDYKVRDEIKAQEAEKVGETVEVTGSGWSYAWERLPKFNDEKFPYYYYIQEEPIRGYTATYTGNGAGLGNRTISVQNDDDSARGIAFRKVNDAKELADPDSMRVISAAQRLEGATLRLTLTAPAVEGDDLSAVTVSPRGGYRMADATHPVSTPGYYKKAADNMSIEWTTLADNDIRFYSSVFGVPAGGTVNDLPDGRYLLEEVKGPEGYARMAAVTVTIENGEVKDATSEHTNKSVTAVNKRFTVGIRKTKPYVDPLSGAASDTPVPGAVLTLTGTDASGDPIDLDAAGVVARDSQLFLTADGNAQNDHETPQALRENVIGDTDPSASVFEWTTIGSAVIFVNLPEGTYTVTEKTTPSGYQTAEPKTFKVGTDADGFPVLAEGGDANASYDQITLSDKQDTVELSKQDLDGNEVEGAKFRLTKADGTAPEGVQIKTPMEELGDEIRTGIADDADGDDYNDKIVTIKATGKFTVRGNTFNHVTVNGTRINEKPELNKYVTDEMTSDGEIVVAGIRDGAYVVAMEDGTEYHIRADYNKTAVTSVNKIENAKVEDGAVVVEAGRVSFLNLADGAYELEETAAPSGFEVVSKFGFTVSGGKVSDIDKTAVTTGDVEIGDLLDADRNPVCKDADGDLVREERGTYYKINTDGSFLTDESGEKIEAVGEITTLKDESRLIVKDDKEALKISKTDIAGSEVLEGAEMTLRLVKADNEGDTLDAKDGEDNYIVAVRNAKGDEVTRTADTITWKSSDKDAAISNLPDGEYELTEVGAPDGYTKVTSSFTFKMKDGAVDTGSVTAVTDGETEIIGLADKELEDGTVVKDDHKIVVKDDISTISISKSDMGGEVLEGAEMTLRLDEASEEGAKLNDKDSEGNYKISVENAKDDKVERTGNTITWTSSDKDVDMKGLPDGKYTLIENTAPDGYTVVTEFTFTIENGEITELGKPSTTG